MSLKKIHDKQPDKFEFTETNQNLADKILKKYPPDQKKSAVMPLLYLAQNQNENWIPLAAMKYIGKFLNMPYINVYEIATFYSMYNLAPVGIYFVQVCTTSPCAINAPMMQVNEDYYEDLDETNTTKILYSFLEDKPLKPGSYRNRKNSAPEKNQILINGHKNA